MELVATEILKEVNEVASRVCETCMNNLMSKRSTGDETEGLDWLECCDGTIAAALLESEGQIKLLGTT